MKLQQLTEHDWRRIEWCLLALFLIGRFYLLYMRYGMTIGFDNDEHLEMMSLLSQGLLPPLEVAQYAYHPPLGFLLTEPFYLLGFPPATCIQLVSFFCSLGSFFLLRETLRVLRLRTKPLAIAWLYLTSSIPLQLFLSTSFNLDVIILFYASAVAYFSAVLVDSKNTNRRTVAVTGLIAALCCASLTKFSGILLFALPLLMVGMLSSVRAIHTHRRALFLVFAFAGSIVLPFYVFRYEIPYGTFFPSNNTYFREGELKEFRAARDAAPFTFVLRLFGPSAAHQQNWRLRDVAFPRLSDTWKDYWLADDWLLWQPNLSSTAPQYAQTDTETVYGTALIVIMPFVLLGGLLYWLSARKRNTMLMRLGNVFLVFSLLHLLALIWFTYQLPIPWSLPTKAIYIPCVTWGLGWLFACAICPLDEDSREVDAWLILLVVVVFISLNHFLPLY